MQTSKVNVLLIGSPDDVRTYILESIEQLGYNIFEAMDIDMAIQFIIEETPDIVICYYELNDLNAFQVYNYLNNQFLRNEIPFVVVFDHYKKNMLLSGLELGIDSFIFPPYDVERISNIIRKHLKINYNRRAAGILKFDSDCKVVPYGVFIADNKRIVETNEMFDQMVNKVTGPSRSYYLNEVFSFNSKNDDEIRFSRFLNGQTKYCILNEVMIKGKFRERYNLYFTSVKNMGISTKVVGIIIPALIHEASVSSNHLSQVSLSAKPDYIDPNLITSRERQVLELSATGCPIKQIAERLGISERTVEKHRSNIIQKTHAENIMEAVFIYGKNHLLNI